MHDVGGAGNRPPASAGRLKEGESSEPLLGFKWRSVAAKQAALDVEIEQFEPVFHARHADKLGVPRRQAGLPEHAAHAPPTDRIEAGDQQLPLRPQHALDFAQYLVRLAAGLKQMRQQHQIERLRGERQFVGVGDHRRMAVKRGGRAPRYPAVTQKVDVRQAHLQREITEQVGYQRIQAHLLPSQHIGAQRGCEPCRESGCGVRRRCR